MHSTSPRLQAGEASGRHSHSSSASATASRGPSSRRISPIESCKSSKRPSILRGDRMERAETLTLRLLKTSNQRIFADPTSALSAHDDGLNAGELRLQPIRMSFWNERSRGGETGKHCIGAFRQASYRLPRSSTDPAGRRRTGRCGSMRAAGFQRGWSNREGVRRRAANPQEYAVPSRCAVGLAPQRQVGRLF